MTQRRKRLAVTAVALPLLAYVAWAGYARFGRDRVQTNVLVGRTEGDIRRGLGPPDTDWKGYQSLATYGVVPTYAIDLGSQRHVARRPRSRPHDG
jgi:hypothetical protein